MQHPRISFRLPVQRRGFVRHRNTTTLCEIADLTERGVLFTADLPLAMSERVTLEVQLDGNTVIQFGLFVVHANRPQFGGRVTALSPDDRHRLSHYISGLILTSMDEPAAM